MILLTRLNGAQFALNPDLIERAEATPDTVVTLVDGRKYVVAEPVLEVIDLVTGFRASVIATAQSYEQHMSEAPAAHRQPARASRHADHNHTEHKHSEQGQVVPLPTREA